MEKIDKIVQAIKTILERQKKLADLIQSYETRIKALESQALNDRRTIQSQDIIIRNQTRTIRRLNNDLNRFENDLNNLNNIVKSITKSGR